MFAKSGIAAPFIAGGEIMGAPQFLQAGDNRLVVLQLEDYEALMASAGFEEYEDIMTARILAESDAAMARGEEIALPLEVWDEMDVGSTVAAVRRYRRLSQDELATLAGVAPSALEAMEATHYPPPSPELTAVARALGAPEPVLTGPL